MAVISSLRSFDREQQKEYLIPIVIKDSGNPAMTGTSTLTVTIRDVNDNKMQPGSKEIFAYNYMVNAAFASFGDKLLRSTRKSLFDTKIMNLLTGENRYSELSNTFILNFDNVMCLFFFSLIL